MASVLTWLAQSIINPNWVRSWVINPVFCLPHQHPFLVMTYCPKHIIDPCVVTKHHQRQWDVSAVDRRIVGSSHSFFSSPTGPCTEVTSSAPLCPAPLPLLSGENTLLFLWENCFSPLYLCLACLSQVLQPLKHGAGHVTQTSQSECSISLGSMIGSEMSTWPSRGQSEPSLRLWCMLTRCQGDLFSSNGSNKD